MNKEKKNNFSLPITNAYVPNQFYPPYPFSYGNGYMSIIPPVPYQQKPLMEETSIYEIETLLQRNYASDDTLPTLAFSKFINHLIDNSSKAIDPVSLLKEKARSHSKIVISTMDFLNEFIKYFGGNSKDKTIDIVDPDINMNSLIDYLADPAKTKEYICISTMVIGIDKLKLVTYANILRPDSPIYTTYEPTNLSIKYFLEELRRSYEEVDITEDDSTDKFFRNKYRLDIGKCLIRYAMNKKIDISEARVYIWYDTYFPNLGIDENGERDLFFDRYIQMNRFSESE